MLITFKPNRSTLMEAMATALLDPDDSVIDCWFRQGCWVTFDHAEGRVIVQDDMGFFFQKWMILVRDKNAHESTSFMGARVRAQGEDVVLEDRSQKLILNPAALRECVSAIVDELKAQLDAMRSARPDDSDEISYFANEYLTPLERFLADPNG